MPESMLALVAQSVINESTTVPIAWVWVVGIAAGGWALWLQRKLSRIDQRLERIEENGVPRSVMLAWILQMVRDNKGRDISIPDLPDMQAEKKN